MQCVVACRSVCGILKCVTVCCSVLQCVAVCCGVLRCVAVCCSVLQCDTLIHTDGMCGNMCCSVL